MYRATTKGFEVIVHPVYLDGQSEPDLPRHVWAYSVRIENGGDRAATLVSRRWEIVDGEGRKEIVDGPGVVGQTPRIEPGGSFEYHSGCPLPTTHGTMHGRYTMVDDAGEAFEIEIPPFSLDLPNVKPTLN